MLPWFHSSGVDVVPCRCHPGSSVQLLWRGNLKSWRTVTGRAQVRTLRLRVLMGKCFMKVMIMSWLQCLWGSAHLRPFLDAGLRLGLSAAVRSHQGCTVVRAGAPLQNWAAAPAARLPCSPPCSSWVCRSTSARCAQMPSLEVWAAPGGVGCEFVPGEHVSNCCRLLLQINEADT